jgi:hypothetical protein
MMEAQIQTAAVAATSSSGRMSFDCSCLEEEMGAISSWFHVL